MVTASVMARRRRQRRSGPSPVPTTNYDDGVATTTHLSQLLLAGRDAG
jgi:hypothetical protein